LDDKRDITWLDRLIDARFSWIEATELEQLVEDGLTPDEAIDILIDRRRNFSKGLDTSE
jgi:hypothetical protein